MPPKSSSKKNQASWYHCETCGVHITSKARDNHDGSCPISGESNIDADSDEEYVRNGTLYTRSLQQRNFEVESLKDLPAKYANMLVFVSEGAMRLSQLHIGQHVVIESTAQEPLVRIVWPVSEQFLTTVFVTDSDYKSNWTKMRGKLLKISALDTKCLTAAGSISLRQISETRLKSAQLKDATALLQRAMVNQIYCQGTKIHFNFFNKSLTFRLESWQGAVEDALAGLSLEAKPRQFVQVTNVTRLQLIPQEEEEQLEEQTRPLRITKCQIGGLDKQLQLVEESMEYALGLRTLPAGELYFRKFWILPDRYCIYDRMHRASSWCIIYLPALFTTYVLRRTCYRHRLPSCTMLYLIGFDRLHWPVRLLSPATAMALCLASHSVFVAGDSAVTRRPVWKFKECAPGWTVAHTGCPSACHDAASMLLSRASRPLQQRPVIDGGIVGSRPREIMSTIPTLIRRRLKH
ncbi:uncharacterized protein LOC108161570 isoform X2 [Drosophila miranda]|uniref:uncharacterized protein LOC108161570 isoform X2 n=1 Tax=Drosophila miranda TaxID=7229 RepID=UPI00143F406C|nr:uncharacterized protein LOC108161570 isoform X2 [Drosophila miranda]